MTIVAFQGEHGAYSEEAVRQHFGEAVDVLPCTAFEEIFESVESGKATYGMVPVENSTAGSINKSYDLLLEHARALRANAIVGLRYESSEVGTGGSATEVLCYGTAVVIQRAAA